ncbi:low molecular weight phosphatase family protein [Nocardia brevicatena]|uniref:arsenate-mycothiol transferase ArsC n=1 Tax=Nocardia brevicatena TaxID=37327 RepID=UPI00059284F3|nr:low molecular weight phosphatase family protein [Nocardia brevicatena]
MTESPAPSAVPPHGESSIDQQIALRSAAGRLEREFEGVFGGETVERFLSSSYDHVRAHADVTDFPPLPAERFTRQRLHALAEVEGRARSGRPMVLFLSAHDAGRGPMALAFFNRMTGDHAVAWSGGDDPVDDVDPVVVEAMREVGIDIGGAFPMPWTEEIARAADVIVTMDYEDDCPAVPGIGYREWDVPDPLGRDIEAVRPIRDELEARVGELVAELRPTT